MSRNQTQLYIITLFVLLFACKKEEDKKDNQNVSETASYTISKSILQPMELFSITSSNQVEQTIQKANIGSIEVELYPIGAKEYAVLCPVLAPGSHTITLGDKFSLTFSVNNYTPLDNPEKEITSFKTEVLELKNVFEQSTIENKTELSQACDYLIQSFSSIEDKLTPTERISLAYLIKNNGLSDAGFSDILHTNVPDSFFGKKSSYDPSEACDEFIREYTITKISLVLDIGLSVGLYYLPDPTFISKGVAVVTTLSALRNLGKIFHHVEVKLPSLMAKAVDMELFQKKADFITLDDNKSKEIKIKSPFTNFTSPDEKKGIFPALFSGVNEVNQKIKPFYTGYYKIKSWFTTTQPSLTEKYLAVKDGNKEKTFELNHNYVSLVSTTNPNIKVSFSKHEHGVILKATSTTVKEKTVFSIKLRYTQANINHYIDKTVDVEYNPGDFSIIGYGIV